MSDGRIGNYKQVLPEMLRARDDGEPFHSMEEWYKARGFDVDTDLEELRVQRKAVGQGLAAPATNDPDRVQLFRLYFKALPLIYDCREIGFPHQEMERHFKSSGFDVEKDVADITAERRRIGEDLARSEND